MEMEKSLIARSFHHASHVSFFDITCTEIITTEVGESERHLHSIFERARSSSSRVVLLYHSFKNFVQSLNEVTDRLLTTLLMESY
ncbi:hypothetical protein TVAG_398830 [Trichomonas vaginalis G3]|uniref:ATPase AAA-type core domain-containing protein n=1 Tax=Trichomonas vaginalis (strain ATCC PRA-98 / G3) TaxID=412133 RepID=A2EVH2_TRIV3|nr:ATP binding [Trichomonas vaginalis G3]EAY03358.1 hypothetical protein TVAG_398830 [Trichomonas vaginalis G3]KAI5518833.1 ATP binding [Trichomonas vaginalis G3]|eukprot:XP_001315581.1 hypothetical protein [Trichomonas vaginalis G3]